MPAFIDYKNKKIGRVSVISLHSMKQGHAHWNCVCDCGENFIGNSTRFKRGEKFECNECILERRRGIDLTGRKFGRWTVLSRTVDCRNKTAWNCVCDCGTHGIVSGCSLGRKNKSWSCGCYGRKKKSKYVNDTIYPPAHGTSNTPFYKIRVGLIHKCYKNKHPSYKLFGSKGITVCELWKNGARDMQEWAISNGWEKGDVICLKEGEKEFNPETVYILKESEFRSEMGETKGTQITYRGETHSLNKWAKILGVTDQNLRKKLERNPSIEEVFNTKFKKKYISNSPTAAREIIELYKNGKSQTEISKLFNTQPSCIRYHLVKNEIPLREHETRRLKKPEVSNEEILRLWEKNHSSHKTSQILGISDSSIRKRLKRLGKLGIRQPL